MKLTRLLILLVTFSFSIKLSAQCIGPKEVFASDNDLVYEDAERDIYGNLYVSVFFTGILQIQGLTFDSESSGGIVILKYDKSGKLIWGFTVEADDRVFAQSITIDGNQDLIIAGSFFASYVNFDCISLTNSGRDRAYLAKINKDGEVVWVQASSGSKTIYIRDVAVGDNGDIVLGGNFVSDNDLSFDGLSTNGIGGYDFFVAKFTNDGGATWLRSFGGTGSYDYVSEVAIDSSGDVIITGEFTGQSINFDGTVFQPRAVSANYYIAKLASDNAAVLWVKTTDNNSITRGWSLALDQFDNIYTTGSYFVTDMVIDGNTLTNLGGTDMFIIKYASSGDIIWIKAIQAEDYETGTEIILLDQDHLAVSGYYGSPRLLIGDEIISNTDPYANSFIAELDSDGEFGCVLDYDLVQEALIFEMNYDSLGNILAMVWEGIVYQNLEIFGDNTDWLIEPSRTPFSIDIGADQVLCANDTVIFEVTDETVCNDLQNIEWSDGSTGTSLTVGESGTYWVQLTRNGTVYSDTVVVDYIPTLSPLNVNDTIICQGTSFQIDISDPAATNYSSNLGDGQPRLTISESGTYWISKSNVCDTLTNIFNVEFVAPLSLDLGSDSVFCNSNFELILDASNASADYHWSTGAQTSEISINTAGIYSVEVSNNCETISDTLEISVVDSEGLFVPNVITPNGDLSNETFMLPEEILPAEIKIFNRWGKPVYTNDRYDNSWDGGNVKSGVYYYQITGSCISESMNGALHVLK